MIETKVISKEAESNKYVEHCVFCKVENELTGDGEHIVPLTPIDVFSGHIPDLKKGYTRTLKSAKTNRKGNVLIARILDMRI